MLLPPSVNRFSIVGFAAFALACSGALEANGGAGSDTGGRAGTPSTGGAAGCSGSCNATGGTGGASNVPLALDFAKFHGFNLLAMFDAETSNGPFSQDDFRLIHELGFNFVRLPIDYRTYTDPTDNTKFIESKLVNVDQAVDWGKQYGIHVCLNLHRAPGYTVNNNPPEPTSLWTDAATQSVFAKHWGMFAARYAGVAKEQLSFNLVNEPTAVSDAAYAAAVRPAIDAIRAADPNRPIVSDGLDGGLEPSTAISGSGVIQATRGYFPYQITHYKASWVNGADLWPVPTWPLPDPTLVMYFFGDAKPDWQSIFELDSPLPSGTVLHLKVHQVSSYMQLDIVGDSTTVWSHVFQPGAGSGEWSQVVYDSQWKVYQNIYDRTYDIPLPSGIQKLKISPVTGDWLSITSLGIDTGSKSYSFQPTVTDFGAKQQTATIGSSGQLVAVNPTTPSGKASLSAFLAPWLAYRAAGGTFFVGEFGAYNKTPEAVTLAWMKDLLDVYQTDRIGWALWNFSGSFGILDSGRTDVTYESYQGHELDRQMLDLLKSHL